MPRIAMLALAALTAFSPLTAFGQATQEARAAGISASASILPEDTYLHVSVPDVAAFCERFQASKGNELYSSEELADVREQVLEKWNELNGMVQGEIGVSVSDILGNADGELVLAVTKAPASPLSLVMWGGYKDEEILDTVIEQIETAYEGEGGEVVREATGGVEITTISIPGSNGPDPEAFSFNYFVADQKWVVGTNRAILEELVSNWDGNNPRSLATNDIYVDMLDKVDLGQGRAPAIIAYFDPINLVTETIQTVSQIDPEVGMQAGMAMGFLPMTGLQGLLGVMSATDFSTKEGYDGITKSFVYTESPTTGLLNLFALREADQLPPDWVSEDVSQYTSFTWDADKAYESVSQLVDMVTGQPGKTEEFLDQMRDMPDGPGLHLKDDILDQLSGTFRILNEPASFEQPNGRPLIVAELKRGHNMDEVVSRLAEAAGGELETRDFRGTTIYEFQMPQQGFDGSMSTGVGGVSVADGNLVFGLDVTSIEEMLRGDADDKLVDSAEFKKAMDGLSSDGAALAYQNIGRSIEGFYNAAQSGQFRELIQEDELTPLFDLLEALPPYEDVEQYFGYSGSVSTLESDGTLTETHYVPRD